MDIETKTPTNSTNSRSLNIKTPNTNSIVSPTSLLVRNTDIELSPFSHRSISIEELKKSNTNHDELKKLNRVNTIERELIRNEIENSYLCFRSRIDKRILIFMGQLIISILILIFCAVKLLRDDKNDAWVIGLMFSVISSYISGIINPFKK